MIHYTVTDHIACIVVDNQPKRNALAAADMVQLRQVWQQFRDDPDARVAVVHGAGDLAFSSGRDITEFAGSSDVGALRATYWADMARGAATEPVSGMPLWKPIIAAIQGHCVGEGLVQALGADLRIAADNARFSMPEIRMGFTTVTGAAVLAKLVGHSAAARLALFAEDFDADEALRVGLVDEVCRPDELLVRAMQRARTIAAYPPLAVQAIKEVMIRSRQAPLEDVIALGESLRQLVLLSDDYQESVRARREGRPGKFSGR